jgi:excisionase family DNA binding protein
MAEKFLTIDDVATAFRMPPRTVRNLAARGVLPGLKIGREWRFRPSTLDAWSREQEAGHRVDDGDEAVS